MKIISILILTLLLFVPPVQGHSDAIIFSDAQTTHFNTMDDAHLQTHHQNDTEEERNTEHHHHCIFLGISSAVIAPEFNFQIITFFQKHSKNHFYKVLNTASYLNQLFQPPIV
ncbi:conserved exported hypothetical protein [Tenacibaculum dicentrarchi]|uniref:DUF2946 domain-containing protein n=1 Tax=Tenacibaculum dicentrarchi TaxID=669041 RepID=A0ABP1EJ48_9FLAO|nr:conserved exported hypothetical protein [Tenacibaculum dicentrarchi]SOS54939.1 conserved exported hypothetical protein [Tenacibaculum dicentrarchi]SOU87951.1 conserved exported hypothetical protein [Tenacibaculum dicentrarchi]